MRRNGGITDEQAAQAFNRFKLVLDKYEDKLKSHRYLAGNELSLLDIAWYIYTRRLRDAGYPIERLHPRFKAWFLDLHAHKAFRDEVPSGGVGAAITASLHALQTLRRSTLEDIAIRAMK